MTDITLRGTKGAPLTHQELDENFANLKETADLAFEASAALGGKANASALGTDDSANDMGTTPGTILSDNGTAKDWFQESEAAIEVVAETKAEATLSNVGAADFASKAFAQPLGTASADLAQRFSHVINLQDDCGGVGENVTMNTAALTDAINQAQAMIASRANMPIGIYVPPGLYKFDAALPSINKSVVIFSDGTRSAQLVPVGNFNAFTFTGTGGARCANAGFYDIGVNAAGMTGGYAIVADWVQDFLLEDFLLANPYNAISLRQAGGTRFRSAVLDGVRNQGLFAFANNTTRNGENDQIDAVSFEKCVFQSSYVAGGASSSVVLMTLDGRVHTIDIAGLRLLNAGKGLVTANTPGLASNFVPRFLTGYGLEVENMYSECLDIPVARDFWMTGLFAVGSQTGNGVKLGSAVHGFKVNMGNLDSNYLSGAEIVGATDVMLSGVKAYNNSKVGASIKSQIYLGAGSGSFTMLGGLAGKEQTLPAYTENGKYGIEFDGAYAGVARVDGVDLRGNATGTIYDGGATAQGTRVSGCRGYNPRGPALQAVGASPYTYTAGPTQEHVNLYSGTGVVSTIGDVAVANTVPASFLLQPRQSVTITYATAPTMAVNKE